VLAEFEQVAQEVWQLEQVLLVELLYFPAGQLVTQSDPFKNLPLSQDKQSVEAGPSQVKQFTSQRVH
jgi:hypothetical protein